MASSLWLALLVKWFNMILPDGFKDLIYLLHQDALYHLVVHVLAVWRSKGKLTKSLWLDCRKCLISAKVPKANILWIFLDPLSRSQLVHNNLHGRKLQLLHLLVLPPDKLIVNLHYQTTLSYSMSPLGSRWCMSSPAWIANSHQLHTAAEESQHPFPTSS